MRLALTIGLLLVASVCWADPTVVTLKLTGYRGSPTFGSDAVFPYSVSINERSAVDMMCDDFADQIALNDSWTADAWALNGAEAGNFLYQSGFANTTSVLTAYQEAAYILTQMSLPGTDRLDPVVGNSAVWYLFNQTVCTGSACGGITSTLADALTYVTGKPADFFSNVTVYTADPLTQQNQSHQDFHPQEFLTLQGGFRTDTDAPEPPASLLMAAGGFILAALGAVRRKRSSRD